MRRFDESRAERNGIKCPSNIDVFTISLLRKCYLGFLL